MKTIHAALFLGLVACVVGTSPPTMPQGCANVNDKAQSSFDFGRFFKDKWILTHAERVSNPNACETFTVGTGNQVTFTLGGVSVGCTSEQVTGARFTKFNCKMGERQFTSYVSVLATDYDNYALVYRCGSHEGPTRANFLVGQRQKTSTFPTGLTSSILSSKGMSQSQFSQFNCR